jgi:hypothetical protein
VTVTSWTGEPRHAPAAAAFAQRVLRGLLLVLLALGAFGLWVGVPAAVLWGLGRLVDDSTQHLVLGLIGVPVGMILFGLLLAMLNTAFLRLSGAPMPDAEEESWRPRLRGPLDRLLAFSAVACLLAFLAWLLFASAGIAPAGP